MINRILALLKWIWNGTPIVGIHKNLTFKDVYEEFGCAAPGTVVKQSKDIIWYRAPYMGTNLSEADPRENR